MDTSATELLADWDRQIAELTTQAETRRNNGMLDSAALMRTQRDTLKQCADALRRLVEAPKVLDAAATEECGDIHCRGHAWRNPASKSHLEQQHELIR